MSRFFDERVIGAIKNNRKFISIYIGILLSMFISVTPFSTHYNGILDYSILIFLEFATLSALWLLFFWMTFDRSKFFSTAIFIIFIAFIISERLNSDAKITFSLVFCYSAFMISVGSVFLFFTYELARYTRFGVFAISTVTLFCMGVLPFILIVYSLSFGQPMTQNTIYAMLQTNLYETFEFLHRISSKGLLCATISIISLIFYFNYKSSKIKNIKYKKLPYLCVFIFFGYMAVVSYTEMRVLNLIYNTTTRYYSELEKYRIFQQNQRDSKVKLAKSGTGETYVVIIGESVNRQQMGCYGYFRDTTPILDELIKNQDLLCFNNAFSNHTHTNPVLSLALTEAHQHRKIKFYDSHSIINIFNQAGFETIWLTNQSFLKGADSHVAIIAENSDQIYGDVKILEDSPHDNNHDENILADLDNILAQKSDKNRLIFIHLMGSHASYAERYPAESYSKFSGPLSNSQYGDLAYAELSADELINSYDNSLYYHDYIIDSIFKRVSGLSGSNFLLYFSDHGEELVGPNGHNFDSFTFAMARIPLFTWCSNEYKENYQERYLALRQNRNKLFCNDSIYDTMIGAAGIEAKDCYQAENDLTSSSYDLSADKASVGYGKIPYTRKDNRFYHHTENFKKIVDIENFKKIADIENFKKIVDIENFKKIADIENLKKIVGIKNLKKILAIEKLPAMVINNVNSVVEFNEVTRAGGDKIEVDLVCDSSGEIYINNGHYMLDSYNNKSIVASDFFNQIDCKKIQHFTFNVSAVGKISLEEMLKQFNDFNLRFKIKNRSILNFANIDALKLFAKTGWNCSYLADNQLNTTRYSLIRKKDREQFVADLVKLINDSLIEEITINQKNYKLFESFEKDMAPNIKINIIDSKIDFASEDFIGNILQRSYFDDKRLNTVIFDFKNRYEKGGGL